MLSEHRRRYEITSYHAAAFPIEVIDRVPVPKESGIKVEVLEGATPPTAKDFDGKAGVASGGSPARRRKPKPSAICIRCAIRATNRSRCRTAGTTDQRSHAASGQGFDRIRRCTHRESAARAVGCGQAPSECQVLHRLPHEGRLIMRHTRSVFFRAHLCCVCHGHEHGAGVLANHFDTRADRAWGDSFERPWRRCGARVAFTLRRRGHDLQALRLSRRSWRRRAALRELSLRCLSRQQWSAGHARCWRATSKRHSAAIERPGFARRADAAAAREVVLDPESTPPVKRVSFATTTMATRAS